MSFSKIYLSESAFRHNVNVIKSYAGNKKIIFPVKSNAYGHGLREIVKISHDVVDYYMTATLDEGILVKENAPEKDVFIDLPLLKIDEIKEAINREFTFNVATSYQLELLENLPYEWRKKAKVQVEFDTGMNRTGFKIEDLDRVNNFFLKHPEIKVEGIFTHYATGKEDTISLMRQYNVFKEVRDNLDFSFASIHSENSAALLTFNFKDMDFIRPGITMYGLKPSLLYDIDLVPILSWKSVIVDIKKLKKNEGVSYGYTFRAPYDMRIATVPVGYGDGYPRNLSNQGYVIIRGKRVKIIGTICMNHFMVDISDLYGVKVGDEVIVIGKEGGESISADEIAKMSGTINYEITTKISPFLPRIIEK